MNAYLQAMKTALVGYYNAAKTCEGKAQEARKIYQQDVASGVVKKLFAQLQENKAAAIDAINEARDKGIEAAQRWGTLDGSKINDGDMKLLKFDLSPEQFETIVDRNRNNGTMCFILKQYAEKHAKHEKKEDEVPMWNALAMVDVPTAEAKVQAYNSFADSAIASIHNMSGNDWEFGLNSPITQASVEQFGEPNGMNDNLLAAIS